MRVVYLNPAGAVGGAERSLLDFLASLRAADASIEMDLIAGSDGPLVREAARLGARAEVLPIPRRLAELGDSMLRLEGRARWRSVASLLGRLAAAGLRLPAFAARLRARLTELSPTLIHSNGLKTHILAALAGPAGVPVLWHVHDFPGSRPLASRALRLLSGAAAVAVANSNAVARDLSALAPALPVETIYYGIDVGHFSPGPTDRGRLDELSGLPRGGPGLVRVGLVATYARWKGHGVFLEAAALVRGRSGASVRFYIVGGPIYATRGSQHTEAELRAVAARLGIANEVGFVPFQSDTASVYRALDVVVHASTEPEPFGRTIVEGMACGRAVIAARAGGAAELFAPGTDALGVPPGDPAALARAIRTLVEDPGLRASLGTNGRRSAVERFSRARLGPELRAAYRRMVPSAADSRG